MANKLTTEQKLRLFHNFEMAKLIRAMKEQFGNGVFDVVAKQNGEKAYQEWKEIASKNESNTINDLLKLLWEPLKKEGFEYDICETEAGVQMRCTRCSFYDMAKHLGITEEAFYMVCASDPYIAEGFNSSIGFKRTKTLMQGHDCCDHFYYIKSKESE